jgi:uncharacterized protein
LSGPGRAVTARDDFADELRGFALLGIAAANAPYLALSSAGFTDASVAATPDRAMAFAVTAFVQAKFYPLFSFLFGYSLSYILADGAEERFRVLRRRLAGLGVIGLAHAWLAFVADILFVYAVLGIALVCLARRSDRVVLGTAAAACAVWLCLLGVLPLAEGSAPAEGVANEFRRWDAVLATGTFAQAALARLALWPHVVVWVLLVNGAAIFALFCLGLVAGRRKLLADPAVHVRFWRGSAVAGLLVGVPWALASAWLTLGADSSPSEAGASQMLAIAIGLASGPALTVAYVALLAILRAGAAGALCFLRPAGRMSLTCYVGQSVILSLVFCGYGLGLFGRLGAAAVTAIALATWLALDLLAYAWLRRHARGPLEWALRWWSHRHYPDAPTRPGP